MLGDVDDAQRLMEFVVKRWGDEAKADAAAAEHFPTVPSDETLAARVNAFLELTSIATNTNVVCAVCGEFHLPDNTDVFHLGKRTDEKTTAKPLGALLPLLKLLKNPKSRVPPPETGRSWNGHSAWALRGIQRRRRGKANDHNLSSLPRTAANNQQKARALACQ